MDKILRQMQAEEEDPPLFGVRGVLHRIRLNTHDCTGPGGLLRIHLFPGSILRQEMADEKRGPW